MKPTQEQLDNFKKHHIHYEPLPKKSLMDMSLDELDKSWKEYQKLVELDEKEKENE